MKTIRILFTLLVLLVVGAGAFIWSGAYPIGADAPHWPITFRLIETLRDRSISTHAQGIQVPNLDDPKVLAEGAEHYSGMCTGCHLAPGQSDSEIRAGLYPQPPDLTKRSDLGPGEMFWTIKHGVKLSAMPAWGTTHDDDSIWGLVAFVRKLPGMTPEEYKAAAGSAEEAGEHHHHHHGAGDESDHHDDHDGAEADHHHNGETDSAGSGAAEPAHHHDHDQAASDDAHDHASAEAPMSMDGLKTKAVPDAEEVALAFHSALQKGDRDAVLALLSADVTVSESGHTQTRKEYASGHLGEDIALLKTAQVRQISLASMPMGESAMVGSESEIRSKVAGQPKVLRSRELLTLRRQDGMWKIIAVRWQSAPVGTADHAADAHDHD